MLIKTCWMKDFIEKIIQDTQPAEAVGAIVLAEQRFSSSRSASMRTFQ